MPQHAASLQNGNYFGTNHPQLGASSDGSDPHQASSIPPWVHANDDEKAPFLAPAPVIPNTRHYKPPAKYTPGKKLDAYRDSEPGLLSAPIADHQVRWIPFMQSGPNPREYRGEGILRSDSWMRENIAISAQEWDENDEKPVDMAIKPRGFKGLMYRGKWLVSPDRQERSVRLFWRLLLKNPFVPLLFRLTVLAFSCAALGIATTILRSVESVNQDLNTGNQCAPRASTYMGIVVPTVAIPYVAYVTWDEYMSKPLGLRSVAAKTLLLLCDLYFIVFSASNVSLAFNALLDESWACYDIDAIQVGATQIVLPNTCPNNAGICYKQRALCGVLIISLVAWLLCFSISVLRVVEKLRLEY